MSNLSRTLLCGLVVLVCSSLPADELLPRLPLSGLPPLVSALDKAVPESQYDMLALQRAAIDVVDRALPATVGIELPAQVVNGRPVGVGAVGSGVVISADGLVLTAAHVVANQPGRPVRVRFPDGRTVNGMSLGIHATADGGLIKITDEGDWPHVPLASPAEKADIGDWCVAMGHPRGFSPDRTPPVRVGRVIDVGKTVMRTDCPITGGDSGGPLLDMKGRVIGIHSRITRPITENYHVPAPAFHEAWQSMLDSEVYPSTPASQLLALLDADDDGQLTRKELDSEYLRSVYDRLIETFDLEPGDADSGPTVEAIVKQHFRWQAQPPPIANIDDEGQDLGLLTLSSQDFVRGRRMSQLVASFAAAGAKPPARQMETSLASSSNSIAARRDAPIAVRVYGDAQPLALGTIVSADGVILTKASRVRGKANLHCLLPNGDKLPATQLSTHEAYDLAFLKVQTGGLPEPNWADSEPQAGQWLVVPTTSGRVESLGVLSVLPRKIGRARAMLGVRINDREEAMVDRVFERGGAHEAGMKARDVILQMNGQAVKSVEEVRSALKDARPGDVVSAVVRRGDKEIPLEILLGAAEDIFSDVNTWRMSGPLSKRRDDFAAAFHFDAPLPPSACGGPILDVQGRVVGVSLARADRVTTLGLHAKQLKPILEQELAKVRAADTVLPTAEPTAAEPPADEQSAVDQPASSESSDQQENQE